MGHQATIRRGMFVVSSDSIYEIEGIDRVKGYKLVDYNTGEWSHMTLQDIEAGCLNGTLTVRDTPHDKIPEERRALSTVQITHLPPHMRYSADRKGFFVIAFLQPELFYRKYLPEVPAGERLLPRFKTKRALIPFAKVVLHAFHAAFRSEYNERFKGKLPKDFEKTPAFSTYCSWITLYEQVGGDQRLMASLFNKRGVEGDGVERGMSAKVETMLIETIDIVYLTDAQNPKAKVYKDLKTKIDAWNQKHPGWQLKCPSDRHVRRYINTYVDKFTATARRKGLDVAKRELGQFGQGPEAHDILEVVEVDHTRANTYVVDDKTGRVLGRPWITALLCRYSRMPIGIHIHFEGQTVNAIMQALRNAMSPKTFLKDYGIDIRYPHGRPLTLFVDRGADFTSPHFRMSAQQFDIRIDYEPVGCPEYKGKIERWWRTLNEEVCHGLPGSVSRKKKLDQRHHPDGKGYITLNAFRRRVWLWAETDYAQRIHQGINDIPMRRWEEAEKLRGFRIPPRQEEMEILLNRFEMCTPSKKGVQWSHLRWFGKPLTEIMSDSKYRKGMKVEVKIDENDVSKAWVIHPVTGEAHPLKPVMKKYMTGLTLYQHRMCLMARKELNLKHYDEATHLQSKALLIEEEQRLQRAKGTRNTARAGMARYGGKGTRAPAGDYNGEDYSPSAIEMQDLPNAEPPAVMAEASAMPPAAEPEIERVRHVPTRKTLRKQA